MTTGTDAVIVWLTPEQAAARAQVGKRVIYHEVKAGRLKAARVGGRRELRLRPEWIDAWLDACATPREA
jgi:excisionase family DNA binding protein